jgi:hypothetical protein
MGINKDAQKDYLLATLQLVSIHYKATRLEDIGYDAHLGQT